MKEVFEECIITEDIDKMRNGEDYDIR